MVNISGTRHRLSGCPCGHDEHTAAGLATIGLVSCEVCDAIEKAQGVTLAFDTVARVGSLGIGEGSLVKVNGQTMRISSISEVTKLAGRVATGYVRMKLREMAPA